MVFRSINRVVQPAHGNLKSPYVSLQLTHVSLQLTYIVLQPIHTMAQLIEFLNNIPFEGTRLLLNVRFIRGPIFVQGYWFTPCDLMCHVFNPIQRI